MIMISSGTAQKVGKPPPPVPPRPSKSVVAEALAKSRLQNRAAAIKEAAKTKSPTRQAPPPPAPRQEITKSKSSYSVNVTLKKPAFLERSISEEAKNFTRPVVYQSSNVKCNNNNNNNNNESAKEDNDVKIVNSGVFRNRDGVQVVGRQERCIGNDGKSRVQVVRKESVKREICGEFVGKRSVKEGSDATNDTNSKSTSSTLEKSSNSSENDPEKKNWDQMLHDRNHVNTLIDEMFASVLEVQFEDTEGDEGQKNRLSFADKTEIAVDYENVKFDNGVIVNRDEKQCENNVPKTVIVIKNDCSDMEDEKVVVSSNTSSAERQKQVKFKDQLNHELLIKELQHMKQDQEKILKRQRKPSMDIYEAVPDSEVKLNTCQIEITDDPIYKEEKKELILDYERIIKMSSLHGLPPLPKSLSGFNLLENHQGGVNPPTPMRTSSMRSTGQQVPPGHLVYPPHPKVNGDVAPPQGGSTGRKSTNLDAQLAILRREMYSLRQLDLSLLSQLWSLNESIQDFRQILQDQEDRALSRPSPSPTPSSGEDMDGDEFYMSASSLNFRPAPPPPTVRRASNSSNGSSLG